MIVNWPNLNTILSGWVIRAATGLMALGAVVGCGGAPTFEIGVVEYVIGPPKGHISTGSGVLARPRALALDSSGTLYVLDELDRRVQVVAPDGQVNGSIGRPGSGPGELLQPFALAVHDGIVRVFDRGRGVIQDYGTDGTHLRELGAEIVSMPNHVSIGSGGSLAYSSAFMTDTAGLVGVLYASSGEVTHIGELVSDDTSIPSDLLAKMHKRKLPDFMRNNALPIFAPDGSLWVFLQTESILERYGSDGIRLIRAEIDVPQTKIIERAFFDWYATIKARDLIRFFGYIEDGVVVGDSPWLLWDMPGNQLPSVTIHNDEGSVVAHLTLQGLNTELQERDTAPARRRFAVDEARSRLYLLDQNTASVWWFELPQGILR